LRIIDVREGVDSDTYVIPGAEAVPVTRIAELNVATGDHLVLYSDGGAHAAQAWVLLRARGVRDVLVLKDGMAAWEDEVLSPLASAVPSDTAQARFSRARALSLWFGGHPRLQSAVPMRSASSAPAATSPAPAAARRRRKTC
jgi:rhodanese-related sulfurtransferase